MSNFTASYGSKENVEIQVKKLDANYHNNGMVYGVSVRHHDVAWTTLYLNEEQIATLIAQLSEVTE